VEAESVAFTVCAHYGLDTSDYSFGYIAGWSGDKELDALRQSLETIRSEAGAIIAEVDGHMAVMQQEREQAVREGLATEVEATLQMFVNDDLARSGELRPDTLEAIRVQGYQYRDGQLTKLPAQPVPESPIKAAEMTTEQNLNMIDGVLNNQPTVAEIEAKMRGGEAVSLSELAAAMKAERASEPKAERRTADERPSIREQLKAGREQLAAEKPAAREQKPQSRELG
jgi:hypothetical protein